MTETMRACGNKSGCQAGAGLAGADQATGAGAAQAKEGKQVWGTALALGAHGRTSLRLHSETLPEGTGRH